MLEPSFLHFYCIFLESQLRSSFPLGAVHWDVHLAKIFPGFSRNAAELRERIPMVRIQTCRALLPVNRDWGSLSSSRVQIKGVGKAAGLL